ncbi:RpiB/LacA/LacB family sugar-phosphate isomerase [Streptococcus suis]|nr:RpiB/LacA/LacB family sugar-phosphate isomerase [Streptococcus suis]
MRIGVIEESTRADINELLFALTCQSASHGDEVYNLGIFPNEEQNYSYVEVAVMISLLIETGSLDFVVTGCSSGQGMMMACNSLPGLRCGFLQTPQDAYLFGRINHGNVASLPLGLNVGWAGELNLQYILEKLFTDTFGSGYPPQDAERKRTESDQALYLNCLTKKSFQEILGEMDSELLEKVLSRKVFYHFLEQHAINKALMNDLRAIRD